MSFPISPGISVKEIDWNPRYPDKEEVKHFLQMVDRLSSFESQQVLFRGHGGAFTVEERKAFPDKTYIRVKSWLEDFFGLPSSQ